MSNFARIIRNKDNSIIAQGEFRYIKHTHFAEILTPNVLISFDNKHFFHLIGNKTYHVDMLKEKVEKSDLDMKDLSTKEWMIMEPIDNEIDIYIDHPIEEIDEDIKDLVYTLNRISGISTCGSCSGHNRMPGYISMAISEYKAIKAIFELLYDHNFKLYENWNVSLDPKTCFVDLFNKTPIDSCLDSNSFVICLRCNHSGYKDIDKLNTILETCIESNLLDIDLKR